MFGIFFGIVCVVAFIAVWRGRFGRSCHRYGYGRRFGGRGFTRGGYFGLYRLFEELDTSPGQEKAIRSALGELGGTFAALRPGTSGETAGVRAAHNDNAIVRLPDGRHLAIAAFLKGSRGTEEQRDAVLASVARAAYVWATGK